LDKEREALWRAAEAWDKAGDAAAAATRLRGLLARCLSGPQRLEALCCLADMQMREDVAAQEADVAARLEAEKLDENGGGGAEAGGGGGGGVTRVRLQVDAERAESQVTTDGGLGETLRAIVALTAPTPRYARYHAAHLQRYLSALGAHPPRSVARADARSAALEECVRAITAAPGGCTSPFPFEAAIWLLEEQEEICGGAVPLPAAAVRRLRTSLAGSACVLSPSVGEDGGGVGSPSSHAHSSSFLGPRRASGMFNLGVISPRVSMSGLTSPRLSAGGGGGGGPHAGFTSGPSSPSAAPAPIGPPSFSACTAAPAAPLPTVGSFVGSLPSSMPPFPGGPASPRRRSLEAVSPGGGALGRSPARGAGAGARLAAAALARPTSVPVQLAWYRGNSIAGPAGAGAVPTRRAVVVPRAASRSSGLGGGESDPAEPHAPPTTTVVGWPADGGCGGGGGGDEGDDDDGGGTAVATPAAPTPGVVRIEAFGMKLAHQFPWAPAASVGVGLALRRRFLADPDAPSTLSRRRQIAGTLARGVGAGADSAAGWKALAELQYQCRSFSSALDTATRGLEWHARRRAGGHEALSSFALSLRLCRARALRRLGRLDEAEAAFQVLAGWVTEGECAFDGLCGSAPMSIRQQALRGLAKIALARGDRAAAKSTYERILGKALIGRGAPAEHWAHAEYAWLAFEGGDLETARAELERALVAAAEAGCAVTDSEIAEHQYRLGRILWCMGGAERADPGRARAAFEAASLDESDVQAAACAWLGHWYREVGCDPARAANCYEQALDLDADAAGEAGAARALATLRGERAAAEEAGASGRRSSTEAAAAAVLAAAAAATASDTPARRAAYNSRLASTWSASFSVRPGK